MLSFIRIDRKPYRWFINQAHRKLLETYLIGKEASVYESTTKNVLKDNSARTIFPMDLPGMNLIVKRYKVFYVKLEMYGGVYYSRKNGTLC